MTQYQAEQPKVLFGGNLKAKYCIQVELQKGEEVCQFYVWEFLVMSDTFDNLTSRYGLEDWRINGWGLLSKYQKRVMKDYLQAHPPEQFLVATRPPNAPIPRRYLRGNGAGC